MILKQHLSINKLVFYFIILGAFLRYEIVYSQSIKYKHYDTDDGLPHNIGYQLLQDSKGYLWIGTDDGLVKFDGTDFKVFSTDNGLTNNYVISLDEAEEGTLWVGTWGGGFNCIKEDSVFHFPTKKNKIKINGHKLQSENRGVCMKFQLLSFFNLEGDSLKVSAWRQLKKINNKLRFVHDKNINRDPVINVDYSINKKKELLFFGGFNGVKVYENDSVFKEKFVEVINDTIYGLHNDKINSYWLGGKGKILNIKNDKVINEFTEGLPDEKIYYLNFVNKETVYFLTGTERYKNRKLYKYNLTAGKLQNITKELGIHADPSQLLVDNENNLWVTTNGDGIYCIYNSPFKYISFKEGHNTVSINAFEESKDGTIWLGTSDGLYYYNGKKIKDVSISEDLSSAYTSHTIIKDLWNDQNDNLLFSVLLYIYQWDKDENKVTMKLSGNNIYLDANQNINGISTSGKLLYVNEKKLNLHEDFKETPFNRVMYKFDGQILTGKQVHNKRRELFDFDSKQRLYVFDENYKRKLLLDKLPVKKINTILRDLKKSIIWIGTEKGLFKYSNQELQQFQITDGLISNKCRDLVMDSNGLLWIGTPRGLCYFDGKGFVSFNAQSGLISNEVNKLFLDSKGQLWVGSSKGATIIDVKQTAIDIDPPFFYMENLELDGVKQDFSLINEFNYDARIRYYFKALTFTNSEKVQYAYRLNAKEWVTTSKNYLDFYSLNPGSYSLEIRAKKFNSKWGKPININFEVLPPWWQSWWAISFYGLLITTLFISFYKYEIQRLKDKSALKFEKLESEKLKEIDRTKTKFFSNISHEFRTPLTLILGPVENLLKKYSDNEINNDLKVVQRNAKNLLQLINQILDLSKIESGKLNLEIEKKDIISELQSILKPFELLLESKDLSLIFNNSLKKYEMEYDPMKMGIIINNLISNALKYTPEGGEIIISVGEKNYKEKGKVFFIEVSDTGIGISEDGQKHIFERYYQADNNGKTEVQGTGIGLALTKELVELHKGDIQVLSQLNKGTTFTINLPVNKLQPDSIVEGPKQELKPLNQKKIDYKKAPKKIVIRQKEKQLVLVVDDNPEIRKYVKQILMDDYIVKEAQNGADALKLAISEIPDLVVSDVMMPEMDGFEFCENLKLHASTSHIPLILLTAKSAIESKIQGLQKGADDYLSKPFSQEELTIRIANLLEQRKKLRDLFSKSLTENNSIEKLNSLDDQFVKKAIAVIDDNMGNTDFDIPFFAHEIGLSRTQLFRKLKAITNQTPTEFNRSIRLKKAVELLAQRNGNVSEVAYKVGFNDPFYFSKCFTKMYGCPPSEYIPKEKLMKPI